MSHRWPEETIQDVAGISPSWWISESSGEPAAGRLVRVFLAHVDQTPLKLTVKGRTEARKHEDFTAVIEDLSIHAPRESRLLPVAALAALPGDVWTLHRSKVRYALALTSQGRQVPTALRTGSAKWQTAPSVLAAPFYGADQDGSRGGWRPELVKRIQKGEYPQYFWDRIPGGGLDGSILRLDHVQPVGLHTYSYELMPYALAPDALGLVMEQLNWLAAGTIEPRDGELRAIRRLLLEEDGR